MSLARDSARAPSVSACAGTPVFISCVWECMRMTEQNHLDWYPSHLFYSVTVLVCLNVSVNTAGGKEEEEVPVTGMQHDTADVTSQGCVRGYMM